MADENDEKVDQGATDTNVPTDEGAGADAGTTDNSGSGADADASAKKTGGKKASAKAGTPDDTKPENGKKIVVNKDCARLTLYGVAGTPILFNADGEAEVSDAELEHFLKVPGYAEK